MIQATSRPTSSCEVRSFLGLLQLLRLLLPNLADACVALNKISGDRFYWHAVQEESWRLICRPLESPKQNVHLDPYQPLTLSTDASGHAIGTVLTQGKDLACAGPRSLSSDQSRYSTIERGLLAVFYDVKKPRMISTVSRFQFTLPWMIIPFCWSKILMVITRKISSLFLIKIF